MDISARRLWEYALGRKCKGCVRIEEAFLEGDCSGRNHWNKHSIVNVEIPWDLDLLYILVIWKSGYLKVEFKFHTIIILKLIKWQNNEDKIKDKYGDQNIQREDMS